MLSHDEKLRLIGSAHAQAMMLVWVRHQIGVIDGAYAPRIHPRHIRKRAARDAILRPLKELEARLSQSHRETQDAYKSPEISASDLGITLNQEQEPRSDMPSIPNIAFR